MPTNEEIFGQLIQLNALYSHLIHFFSGKIEYLRKKHHEDVREFNRSRRIAQARVSQGLKDKLNERRSRRSRMDMHSRQLEALKEN